MPSKSLVDSLIRVRSFPELFEQQVEERPGAIAVSFDRDCLTYAQLNRRANQLAHWLQAAGIGRETLVAVYCARSLELMTAVLAVAKCGAAFVPVDPTCPSLRRDFILADSQAKVVLTQEPLADRLPRHLPRLCLDVEWSAVESCNPDNPAPNGSLDDLAYVLYTSGSTGQPKGVEILQRGLANYLLWATEAYDVAGGAGSPVHSSIGFDATITSWFTPLVAGKKVVMLPEQGELEALATLLQGDEPFSLIKITPAHLEALAGLLPEDALLRGARAFVIGGEALFASQLALWQARAPHVRMFNEYGPTETVVGCCVYEASPDGDGEAAVPIGRPIANTQLYVLDENSRQVSPGTPGELYIGGDGVARGYHNRSELTNEKFLANPFGRGRLYRTGDLVRSLPDGNLVYLGRLDDQVKIRGHRIELGEIEATLSRHPSVQSCAALAIGQGAGKRLVAYVVARRPVAAAAPVRDSDLKRFLAEILPPYMFPSAYVFLERMPLTSNGKVDRAALASLDLRQAAQGRGSPRTNLELQLLRMWESVLGVRPIGTQDNFFDLGGHSLIAVRLMSRIEKVMGRRVPMAALFQAPTVEKMARLIAGQGAKSAQGPLVPIQPNGSVAPLFCIHGVGGNILSYGHLARYLPDDRPLYGLQARGLNGTEPPHSRVEDMAADYIRQMRLVQPDGPYYLSGYSFGGVVAFEMARQLEAAGESVGSLLLLDSTPQGVLKTLPAAAYCRAFLRRQARRIQLHGGTLLKLTRAEMPEYLHRQWRTLKRRIGNRVWQTRYKMYTRFGVSTPREFQDVKEAAYLAISRYVPGTYSGGAVLFRAEQHAPVFDDDPSGGWQRLILGGVELRIVPGEHNTIAVGENAAVLAREMTAVLERAQALASRLEGEAAGPPPR